jgi:hypothetical protein
VILLWQVGWIDCLVLAYSGNFLNFILMRLFFCMADSNSGLADSESNQQTIAAQRTTAQK